MCGIAGYWNLVSGRPARLAVLRAMTAAMTHRGPDEEGHWVEGPLAIGMRRLQVIDPGGGSQPMSGEDGTVQVVFNGEIYNHEELRRELQQRGHTFRTRSDTEAIVHSFEEWGPGCVRRFNGMFALAVFDARNQRLLLARDRLGIKPLYVYEGPEGVVFGSELKTVIASPSVPVDWDLEAVDDFLTYEYVPAPKSIVRGVRKVPAATALLYERGGNAAPRVDRYWRPRPAANAPSTPREGAEELRRLMQLAVKRRLMADVPLGAFLSGGIDSSIIVALMSRETPGRVRSFSLGFADRSYNELPYARLLAERYGTTHKEELVTPSIVDLATKLAGYFDEPFGDVSAFPTYMIASLARREVTVALSGDGGDELFAGYDHYRADRLARRLQPLTGSFAWRLLDRIVDRVPPTSSKKGLVNKAKRFVEGVRRPADLEHARWWIFLDPQARDALYSPALRDALAQHDPFAYYRERLAEGAALGYEGLQRRLFADVTGYLVDDILVKVDRMSMAVSLEARVPFLDHELVEYAFALPAAWKLKGDTSKKILRDAFSDLLPAKILGRGKEGFSIPMKNWLRGPLKPLLLDLLHERRLRERGWFEPREVARLIDEHLRGRENHAHRLWCMMNLELSVDGLARRGGEREAVIEELAR